MWKYCSRHSEPHQKKIQTFYSIFIAANKIFRNNFLKVDLCSSLFRPDTVLYCIAHSEPACPCEIICTVWDVGFEPEAVSHLVWDCWLDYTQRCVRALCFIIFFFYKKTFKPRTTTLLRTLTCSLSLILTHLPLPLTIFAKLELKREKIIHYNYLTKNVTKKQTLLL